MCIKQLKQYLEYIKCSISISVKTSTAHMNKFAAKKGQDCKHNKMEKRQSFQQMVLNQLDIQAQNNEPDPDLTLLTKVNSKRIIDLKENANL